MSKHPSGAFASDQIALGAERELRDAQQLVVAMLITQTLVASDDGIDAVPPAVVR